MINGLGRYAGKSGNALCDKVTHAVGNRGLFEELSAVPFGCDDLVELLDLIAELD